MTVQSAQGLLLHGAQWAINNTESVPASVEVAGDRIGRIIEPTQSGRSGAEFGSIDLGGFQVLPGFINAHDHLQYALFPRLGVPPYRNYVDWGSDIHERFGECIAQHKRVSKRARLWWGGIRNLLCGVTTVCHHDPLWPELIEEGFPVRVVRDFGWAHSFALTEDLTAAYAATPKNRAFIIHAGEGTDKRAHQEIEELDRLGFLNRQSVLVHALAVDSEGAALIRKRGGAVILCPSSNKFLFGIIPDLSVLGGVGRIALGSDSSLTALGDFLDEIRFAIRNCKIAPHSALRMATTTAASMLRLEDGAGSVIEGGPADLIAVRNTGEPIETRLQKLTMHDIEFVMIQGEVKLVSPRLLERLPCALKRDLEPLQVDGSIRWLRAPVLELLTAAEQVLGEDKVHLGYRKLTIPAGVEAPHGC
ncbi:MAG: amidohydrolase family protein [Acidobacteria bacterium]|nr:amidohydrolase family protein [Acidobacteriota bacterium]